MSCERGPQLCVRAAQYGEAGKRMHQSRGVLIGIALSALAPAPTIPECYRLIRGEWSRPLGVNARYHALPAVIRLDTMPASRGGWVVSPDVAFPIPNHYPAPLAGHTRPTASRFSGPTAITSPRCDLGPARATSSAAPSLFAAMPTSSGLTFLTHQSWRAVCRV